MEQVFRIEIPVEVTSKGDLAKVQQIQAILEKADQEARKLASSADSAFSKIASGASSAASSMQKVEDAAKESSQSMDKIGNAADKAADSTEEVGDAAKDAGNAAKGAFDGAGQSADKFSQRMQKSEKSLRQMFKEKFKMTMEAIDKVSPVIKEIKEKVKSFAAKAWKVTVKLADLVTAPFRALKNMIMSPITMTLSIAGIGLGASSFYNTYTEFTAGMSNVKALSGATEEEFKRLTATASELGATTKFTAAEASQGMQYLAMAGWETNQIIDAMPGLLQLAAAGATDLGTASDIVSDVMTAMGMSANEATRAADVFARTATSTNTTVQMLGDTMKYAAPAAKTFGLQLEDVSALAGMMANAGIKGSSAGTALRTALLRMASPTKDAAKAMAALNLSFDDGKGNMKDMKTIIRDMSEAFKNLGGQEKMAYAEDLFGKNASTAWLAILDQGADKYEELSNSLYDAKGAAEEMANTQMDNLTGDVTLLQSAVDGMKVSLMDKLNPYLREGVQWLTSKIPQVTEALGNLIDKAIDKAKELKERFMGVFDSAEFKNADSLADKFFIAWDKIIAEPFNAWWEGSGREFVLSIVKKVGSTFGEVLHGVVAGIFAAIKGEEIDFEGMNLTGIAKAGAEAAKEYVGSFVKGLDAGNLISEIPGSLKAGLIGFGALKLGGGIYSGYKSYTSLAAAMKILKGGALTTAPALTAVGESAAAAATSAAGGASAFSGLGSALAAIPGWGWAALAAIAALTIGYKIYSDQQEKHRQELLHMGDAVEAAGERYVKAVEQTRDLDSTLESIQEIKLCLTEDKQQNEEVIAQVKGEMEGILHQEMVLTATLVRDGYDTEEAKTILDQVHSAARNKAELEAKLKSGNYDKDEAAEIEAQIKEAESEIAILTTALVDLGYDKDKVDTIIGQIQEIETKNVTLTATLDASGYNTLQAGIIMAQYNALSETQKEATLIIAANTDMAEENIATLVTNLTDLMAMKAEKEIKLSGFGLSALQIALLESQLKSMEARKAEIEILVSEGEGTPEMMDEYNTLTAETKAIKLKLEGAAMTPAEKKVLTDQVDELKKAVSDIVIKMQTDRNSTFKQEDINALMELLGTAGDYQWHLGVNLATGSVTADDLETYNRELEAYAQHLEEISGGMIKAEDVMNGTVSDEQVERAKSHAETEQRIAMNEMRAEVYKGRGTIEEQVAQRDTYKQQLDAATAGSESMDTAASTLQALQDEVREFYSENEANRAMMEEGSMSKDDYWHWYEENNKGQEWYDRATAFAEQYGVGGDLATQIAAGYYPEEYFNGDFVDIYARQAEFDKLALKAQQDYDTQNESLVKQYTGERDLTTYEAAKGTEYAGKNIEELAMSFNSMDATGFKVFADAVDALKGVNAATDYIDKSEMTSPEQIAQMAYKSVTQEANGSLMDYTRTGIQGVESQYKTMVSTAAAGGPAVDTAWVDKQIGEINAALASLGSDVSIDSLDNIQQAMDALGSVDLENINFEEALGPVTDLAGDVGGLGEKVAEAKTQIEELCGVDLSALTFDTPVASAENLSSKAGTARSKVALVAAEMKNLDGLKAYADIFIRQHGSTNVALPYAEGGILSSPHVGLVAEDGPEAIIPLGGKRRERGLDLWMEAGRLLGVGAYAEGGILGPYSQMFASLPEDVWDDDGGGSGDYKPSIATGNGGTGGGNVVQVSVDVSPEYSINADGSDPEAVLEILRSHQNELAELLGSAMANQLEDIISNM